MCPDTANLEINLTFMKISKRAEGVERAKLVETFVDIGPLFTLLNSRDHQVLYGRRGTGKTHALIYLSDMVSSDGIPIYVDMRTVGSTGGIYSDPEAPISERATRLLMDTLGVLHEALMEYALNAEDVNLGELGPLLDHLAEAITEVTVVGSVETEESHSLREQEASSVGIAVLGHQAGVPVSAEALASQTRSRNASQAVRRSGVQRHRVVFGQATQALQRVLDALSNHHVWVLLDEWSAVPIDLQPYLADLFRRSVFPTRGITVKIAAIEQRTNLRILGSRGDYIGIELGADASANVSLDDFMVFENDPSRATQFYKQLIFKHYASLADPDTEIHSSSRLISAAFTQQNTFEEFVRAAEGVPRDALNILSLAAERAWSDPISMDHVRVAARMWYQRDKETAVGTNPEAQALLHWIIDEVIAHRRARAFLLKTDARHHLIDALFDARVLHVLKRSISAHDQPGVRYDSYKIDYGCYVDLLTTKRAPLGLFLGEDESLIDVPPDDYRAIRRAILDLDTFKCGPDADGVRVPGQQEPVDRDQ